MSSKAATLYESHRIPATGALMEVRSLGFKPRRVRVFNVTNSCSLEWDEQLAAAYGIKHVAAGDTSVIAAAGITPLDADTAGNPGFSLGAAVDINDTAGEDLIVEAWG